MHTIGLMRNYKEPTKLALIMAKTLRYYGIDLVYFTPRSVNMMTNKVIGDVLRGEIWVRTVIDVPKIIDISPICFQKENEEVINYLMDTVYLTDDMYNRINKYNVQQYIKEDADLAKYAIPSQLLSDVDTFMAFIYEHTNVVLKPEYGGEEKHVYLIERGMFGYRVKYDKKAISMSEAKLKELIHDLVKQRYIVQKFIHSQTLDGQPFNCRLHFEKDGFADWEIASYHAKVDIEKNIVGKIEQKNGVINIEYIFGNLFKSKWKEINEKVLELADILPYKIEQIRQRSLMTLGIDIGVSRNGNIYIFEVIGAPSTEYIEYSVVNFRSQYYKYLLDQQTELDNMNQIQF